MAKVKRTVYECDNPECGRGPFIEPTNGDPVFGFHVATVVWHRTNGGESATAIFACSEECLTPAILERLDRTRRE